MYKIAVDGPAGAGKSTISKAAANELGIVYVDTGALYRAIALYMLENGVDIEDEKTVSEKLKEISVDIRYINSEQRVILCENDVSDRIRTPEISAATSRVSAIPDVREFLFETQRNIADAHSVIMDGRDIGTVVLPDADVKIFLKATPEDRAMRRTLELREKGMEADYEKILENVRQRDYNDSHREIAPLKEAEDAIILDTTGFELCDSIALVTKTIKEKLGL